MEKKAIIEENTTPEINKLEKKSCSKDKKASIDDLDNDLTKTLSDAIRDRFLGKKTE